MTASAPQRTLMPKARASACRGAAAVALVFFTGWAHAEAGDWAVPLYDGGSGASCKEFNLGANLPWRNVGGDWLDAQTKPQGTQAFAAAAVDDTDDERPIAWDLTKLLQGHRVQPRETLGLLLRDTSPAASGKVDFHSREASLDPLRPKLRVDLASGGVRLFDAAADSTLDCSSSRSQGARATVSLGKGTNLVLSFDLKGLQPADVRRAVLQMTTTGRQYGATRPGVFLMQGVRVPGGGTPTMGLAARYPADKGIGKDPAVVAAIDFERRDWQRVWTQIRGNVEVVGASGAATGYRALQGDALQVTVPTGKVQGANLRYGFRERTGAEPEEMYVRYYLRFASNWNSRVEGGKLPGFAGTYNRGGWGGRRANGSNGWSMRGYFHKQPEAENPLAGRVSIGTYAYHAEMPELYGDVWMWSQDGRGLLERERWYCIEQYVRLNDVGRPNGILRTWVDGQLAMERTALTYRTTDSLRIEDFWFDVYHGGTKPAPSDQQLYVDNIVIARSYIGPMKR